MSNGCVWVYMPLPPNVLTIVKYTPSYVLRSLAIMVNFHLPPDTYRREPNTIRVVRTHKNNIIVNDDRSFCCVVLCAVR